MVRYRKAGPGDMTFTAQTTGGTIANIANSGVTMITSTAAERYVLAAPVPGCWKKFIFPMSDTTGTRLIELSSVSSSDAVTLRHTTGGATATEILYESTVAGWIELVGVTTSLWHLVGSGLGTAITTGVVFQAS